jgi:hypothetical protein
MTEQLLRALFKRPFAGHSIEIKVKAVAQQDLELTFGERGQHRLSNLRELGTSHT